MTTVLLVEDNERLNEINHRALEGQGYTVLTALTLAQARAHLAASKPEVILLDVLLPDGNGIDFCGEIRNQTDAHILFLTSRTDQENRLRGLDIGGDDYISKPYKLEEMLSRVRAAVRRQEREHTKQASPTITCGQLVLNTLAAHAFWGDRDLLLTPKEFALLLMLVRSVGQLVAGGTLSLRVWGQPLPAGNSALRTHLSRLKGKLESASNGNAVISGSRGRGYMLVMKV